MLIEYKTTTTTTKINERYIRLSSNHLLPLPLTYENERNKNKRKTSKNALIGHGPLLDTLHQPTVTYTTTFQNKTLYRSEDIWSDRNHFHKRSLFGLKFIKRRKKRKRLTGGWTSLDRCYRLGLFLVLLRIAYIRKHLHDR